MTNEEVKNGFSEVYNNFWANYKDKPLGREHEEEWERMCTWSAVLMKKYPFMTTTIAEMVAELDHRAREREG